MKRDCTAQTPWNDGIKKILNESKQACEALSVLNDRAYRSDDEKAILRSLRKHLFNIQLAAENSYERLCRTPARKFIASEPLTKEEFFLLQASGLDWPTAKDSMLSVVEDYEVLSNLHYEGNGRICYIDLRQPAPG